MCLKQCEVTILLKSCSRTVSVNRLNENSAKFTVNSVYFKHFVGEGRMYFCTAIEINCWYLFFFFIVRLFEVQQKTLDL